MLNEVVKDIPQVPIQFWRDKITPVLIFYKGIVWFQTVF